MDDSISGAAPSLYLSSLSQRTFFLSKQAKGPAQNAEPFACFNPFTGARCASAMAKTARFIPFYFILPANRCQSMVWGRIPLFCFFLVFFVFSRARRPISFSPKGSHGIKAPSNSILALQ
ncbi:MAG: hypothetical protein PHY12_01265 [Eubacteriales bacterium]|nr:hypothetical protein [Eubacteriales bacterium]